MSKKIIGYIATDGDKEDLKIVREALEKEAEQNSYEIVKVFEDEGVYLKGGFVFGWTGIEKVFEDGDNGEQYESRAGFMQVFDFIKDKKNKDIDGILIFELDSLTKDLSRRELEISKDLESGKRIIKAKIN